MGNHKYFIYIFIIMKFEFDHKTGMMSPKKDENIYFAKSQGGGLIVDDRKHNIKFIIERDENVTRLFGNFEKGKLNFYDMRDARMISDRVIRMFGRNHKYADFHYFLKGYTVQENVIKTCSDFLGESVWGDLHKRGTGEEIESEKGQIIGQLEDGTKLVIGPESYDGKLVEFDDGSNFYNIGTDWPIYIAVVNEGDTDIYYVYDEDEEDLVNMVECFRTYTGLREDDFGSLRAVIQNEVWSANDFMDLTSVDLMGNNRRFDIYGGLHFEYMVFDDYENAKQYAIDDNIELLEDAGFDEKNIEHWRSYFGDDFLNMRDIKDAFQEYYESYYEDLDEEDAIDELIRFKVITDDEEYFELDEDGEPDHSEPKFDYQDYGEEYANAVMDDIDDIVDEFISLNGMEALKEYVDIDELSRLIVDTDGPGNTIARYDGKEREEEIDGKTYYIYRTN